MRFDGTQMRRVLFTLAAVVSTYCGGQSVESGSSESHFLAPCDAGCDVGLTCICGVCTKLCDTTATCTGLSSGASCAEPTCEGATDPVCEATCAADGDCSSLGDGFECAGERCRMRTSLGGDGSDVDPTTMTCDEREQLASQRVVDAIQAADTSCESESDCVTASNSSGCHAACGAVVSTLGAETLSAAIAEIDGGLCRTFESDGCSLIIPPCASPGEPVCVAGTCSESFAQDCSAIAGEADDRLLAAAASADLSCTADADCSYRMSISSCHASCSYFLASTRGEATVQAAIDAIDATLCSAAPQCEPQILPCPAPPSAACYGNVCGEQVAGGCDSRFCPTAGTGTACCISSTGPCGLDSGMGCLVPLTPTSP